MQKSLNNQFSELKSKMKNLFQRREISQKSSASLIESNSKRTSARGGLTNNDALQVSAITLNESVIFCPLHADEDGDQYFCINCLVTFCLGCSNSHQMHSVCPLSELRNTVTKDISYLSQKITEFLINYKPLNKLPEFTLEKMWDFKQIEEARKNMHSTVDFFFDKIKSNYSSQFKDLPNKEKSNKIYET